MLKSKTKSKNIDESQLSHTKYNCLYHIVFIPKYRRKAVYGNLKYKYGQRTFWARGYYVSTVGLNKNTIKKYIREQETEDMLQDKRSVKEYEDPFKGC